MEALENKILKLKSELDYNDNITPLYIQLAKLIKLVIRAGGYEAGEKLPSERVMSDYFSMARGTLRKTIDELLQEDIVQKKQGKGIYVSENYKPKNIKIKVGLIYKNNLFSVSHPMNAEHIAGINSVFDKYGYSLELIGVDANLNVKWFQKDLKDKNINGIISFIAEEPDNKKIEKVINNMPFVSKMKYNNVAFIDFKEVLNLQFHYLYDMGHRNICLNFCSPSSESTELMLNEYDILCDEYNIKKYKYEIKGFGFEYGEIVKEIVKEGNITAIISADDFVAVGMIRNLYQMGIGCPKDISIMGMGDYYFAKWTVPAITTIKLPYYEVGVRLAQSLINQKKYPRLMPILIERESVKKIL